MTQSGFAELTPENFEGWLADHRARAGLWVFQHIPKTAGSSLANEISFKRRPYRNINVAHQPKELPQDEKLNRALDGFLSEEPTTGFQAASGHLRRPHMDLIREHFPDARFLTFLRDPFNRILSDYRYTRTPAHPTWQQVIRNVPDFDAYLRIGATHNKMAFFIFGRADLPHDEAVEMLFDHYSFIGLQERYPLSFTLLSSLLWEPQLPGLRKRVTEERDENRVEVTQAHRDEVAEKNSLDQALVDAVEAKLAAIEPVVPVPQEASASSGAA